jgi:6,7-dimethyl-8-ribityllumazine synthase
MTSHHDDSEGWPYREALPPLRPPEPERAPEPGADREAEADPAAEEPAAVVLAPPAEEEQGEEEAEDADEPAPEEAQVALAPEPAPEHAVGALHVPDGFGVIEGAPAGGRRTVGIVVSRFNGEITNDLLRNALEELEEAGVPRDAVTVMPVPGAFELPLAAMALAKTRRYACVIALGCVIRGETPHFDFVAGEAASGLQLAAVETGVPVSFGLLTCETREQAEARVGKGREAVRAGLEMADLFAQLRAQARS